MDTTSNSLSADLIREKIMNSKGQFVKASWKSNPKPAAAYKNVKLEKHSIAVVQAGVNYANLSAVKEGIANGERGEVQELPWGTWKQFPYIIEHKGQEYIRLYPSTTGNHKTSTKYFVNDTEVDKNEFAAYLTPSEAKSLFDPEKEVLCFTIKSENILGIPTEVIEG